MDLKQMILDENPSIEFDKQKEKRILSILTALVNYFAKNHQILKFIFLTVKFTDEDTEKIGDFKHNSDELKKLSDESITEKLKSYAHLY